MASVSDNADQLNCDICFQLYTEPRILPGCKHCFCESCIVNFVLELKNDEKLGSEFGCPVCKLPSNSPGMDDSIHRWVKSLEVNEEMKAKSGTEIKTEVSDIDRCCRQCLLNDKTIFADKYCLTCKKDYCDVCSKTLHAFEVNKEHVIVASRGDDSVGVGEEGLKILTEFITCPEHPTEAVAFYCKDDNMFCCAYCCVDNHHLCRHVKSVSSLLEQLNIKSESTKLHGLIDNMLKHIDNVITAIKENNNENKKKAEELMVKFQDKKQKVISLLDIMEANLNDEGKAAVKNAALKNQDEIDELERSKRELKSHYKLLDRVVEDASDDQAYVCIHEIERKIEEIEGHIISKGHTIKTSGVQLTTSDTFELIQNLGPNETAQLASIAQPDATIFLPAYEDRPFLRKFKIQAIQTHSILPDDANKNPDYPSTLSTPTYNDMLFLPENKLLLVDSFYGFCCTVNKELTPSKKWSVLQIDIDAKHSHSNERHATHLGENMIAISVASHKTILLVTADGMYTNKGDIKCRYVPKAICSLNNGDIAVAWDQPIAFGIISGQIWPSQGKVVHGTRGSVGYCEKVYFTKDNSGRELKSFQFMAIDEDRRHVIQPCSVDKVVYCYDMDGKPIFCYSNEQLKDPRGVALDSERNIYVCEITLGLIHIISPDGVGITVVKEGCPEQPLAIGFNTACNEFVVTTDGPKYDAVHFFKLSPK